MSKLLSLSIDVTKINKSELITGEKGTYLNLTVSLNDEADKFGNTVSAWQSQTKEQREAKVNRTFLGNGKVIFDSEGKQQAPQVQQAQEDDNSLPF
jgi:hypothetical protein